MTNKEFITRAKKALSVKTLYVMGCFGAPLNVKNKTRYTKNHTYNKNADRTKMINEATDDTFGFDCVCLLKGIRWGWNGDKTKVYGGANYCSDGVPDFTISAVMKNKTASTDFNQIKIGEAVCLKNYEHIGIYIGDGLVIESTPSWKNGVQVTKINKDIKGDYPVRKWDIHAEIPYIEYIEEPEDLTVTLEFATTKDKEDAEKAFTLLGFKIR